jgi:hypothetical protein
MHGANPVVLTLLPDEESRTYVMTSEAIENHLQRLDDAAKTPHWGQQSCNICQDCCAGWNLYGQMSDAGHRIKPNSVMQPCI